MVSFRVIEILHMNSITVYEERNMEEAGGGVDMSSTVELSPKTDPDQSNHGSKYD